jgi:hypothetical protein
MTVAHGHDTGAKISEDLAASAGEKAAQSSFADWNPAVKSPSGIKIYIFF